MELTHIALRCADLERSIAFYRDWCGLEVLHRRADEGADGKGPVAVAWLGKPPKAGERPGFVIVLLENRVPPGRTSLFDHIGFSVATRAAVDELAARAKKESILHWPAEYMGPVVGYLCAILDPDGNVAEFSCGQQLGPDPKESA